MARQNPIGILIQEGSNANGRWLRVGGTLQCWHTVTLTFSSVSVVAATWTFPTPFKSATIPKVIPAVQDNLANSTPSFQELSTVFANEASITNTSTPVTLARLLGQTNFVSGNTVKVAVFAIGQAP